MSLDVSLTEVRPCEVFSQNITHNMTEMAEEAGIYKHLWYPEELGITKARELIEPLTAGLIRLQSNPRRFKKFNPRNGWGDYEGFVRRVKNYLQACIDNPEATVTVDR